MPPRRSLWADVIDRRRSWHDLDGVESMETWEAADPAWIGRLEDVTTVAVEVREGGDGDPRAALVDVLAVASAWVDKLGDHPPGSGK